MVKMSGSTYREVQSAPGKPSVPHAHSDRPRAHSDKQILSETWGYTSSRSGASAGVPVKLGKGILSGTRSWQGRHVAKNGTALGTQALVGEKVENLELFKPDQAGILSVVSPVIPGGFMNLISQGAKWTPHELKTASILHERRTEDVQLQQLRLRLQKKMQEEADRASASTAA